MQTDAITADRLRALAGYAYDRGEAYWRAGRVVSCAVDGNMLRGEVRGTRGYEVSVMVQGGLVRSACTCPMGFLCKHAVALLLHHLATREPPAKKPVEDVFANYEELAAFVKQHRIEHALATSASVLADQLALPPRDYWRDHVIGQLTLRDVGTLQTAARYGQTRGLDLAIARAAYRAFHAAAASVRDGIAEEATRSQTAPEPGLAKLWHLLQAHRATIRPQASPRSRAERAAGKWSFDARELAIEWREPTRIAHPHGFGTVAAISRLAAPDGETLELHCSCGQPNARCAHALALIDSTLDRLEDPAWLANARTLAEQLLRPRWARALAELDRFEELATRPTIEAWWQLDTTSTLALEPVVKKLAKRGTSRGMRITVEKLLADHAAQLDERDLRIAEALAHHDSERETYPVRAFGGLVGHPRVVFRGDDRPVTVERLALGFNLIEHGDEVRVEPAVAGARFSPKLLASLLDAYGPGEPLVIAETDEHHVALVEVGDPARQLWTTIAKHGDLFPPESHTQLLERVAKLEARVPIAVPRSLKGRQLASDLTTVIRLRLLPGVEPKGGNPAGRGGGAPAIELELFIRPAPGTPLFPPGSGPRDVLIVRDGERAYVRRTLGDELEIARKVLDRLPMESAEEGPPQCFRISDPDAALALVAAVQQPSANVEAEWVDDKPYVRRSSAVDGLRVKIEHKRDWFGITGDLKYEDGRIELAILLDAARRQQRFVRVDANRWVELSAALSQKLLAVSDQVFAGGNRLELSPGAVPAIRALVEAGARVEAAAQWERLTERLAASQTLRPKPPATLNAKLRDYQIEGHAWLTRVAAWGGGACLADDMGLGKTVQAIAVLLDRAKLGPALVLVPTSVAYNWVDELRRFAPSLRPVLYGDTPDRAGVIAKLGKRDVLIASYGLLVRDIELLASRSFATLVADEAQALKNSATRRAKAARLLQAEFRVALSGTPFENHLGELWSLYSIVFPGLFGSWDRFRERFAIPIEKYKDADARVALSRVLRPFMLRRTKQEVARELPARTEIDVPITLSDQERAVYEDARLAAVAELSSSKKRDEQRRFQVLAALTRLRLLACHPKLYDPASRLVSSKLARAVELLEELRDAGHRALVFSQFTSHLALVREALAAAGFRMLYLDGSTPARERASLVEEFQTGDADAFLISLKAGGQGINLTAADYILHLDPWWNPAVEDQATDRAHRIGQTKPVTVYRLIARETIEDQIRSLHHAKRALVASVLEGTDAAARLTIKDLVGLLAAH